MPLDNYNGWSNWETWNINLWVMNDEGLYASWKSFLMEDEKEWTDYLAEFFVEEVVITTEDGVRHDNPRIDWQELADNWNEN